MFLRQAVAADAPALTAALLDAVNWNGPPHLTRHEVLAAPHLAHYVTGWPRAGDRGRHASSDAMRLDLSRDGPRCGR